MQIITDSAEHQFLTTLEKIRHNPAPWVAHHYALSRLLKHADVVSDLSAISTKINTAQGKSRAFADELGKKAEAFSHVTIYVFSDGDVLMLAQVPTDEEKQSIEGVYQATVTKFPQVPGEQFRLSHELYNLQKVADQKLLSQKRFQSYEALTDNNKISSLSLRRSRRHNSVVLIVEDDRFTASYTSGLLGKDYDVVVCRTGEEGVIAYVEHAPDIAFLDIHLPGMSGHDALAAISAMDPDAYVVMLSVDTVKDSIIKASQGGARNFLKKPFTKDRILNIVKNSPHVLGFDLSKSEDGS